MIEVFKRFLSGMTAISLALSMCSTSVFADEYEETEEDAYCEYVPSEDGELSAEEILGNILKNEDLINSDSIMVQEMMEDMTELELSGTDIIGGNLSNPDWIATPSEPDDQTSTHANIVKAIRSYLSSKYNEPDKDQIIALMVYSANIADAGLFHDNVSDSDVQNDLNNHRTQLHAVYKTNYLTNLKVLWKYAKLAPTYTCTQVETKIENSMTNLNSDDYDDMETLFETIRDLYSAYKSHNHLNRDLTKRERKYLVMGFALHLIGDIYAHATIIPNSYGANINNNPYFDKNDFISTDDFNTCMSKIVSGDGTDHFRVTECNKYLKNHDNSKYEDNKSFMPQRIKLAKYSAIKFISRIQTSGQNFSSDYVFRHYVTSDGVTYDVTLARFNTLATRL